MAPTSMPTAFTALGSSVSDTQSASRSASASAVEGSPCFTARKRAVDSKRGPARSRAAIASFLDGFGRACMYSKSLSKRFVQRPGIAELTICKSPGVAPATMAPVECSGSASPNTLGNSSGSSRKDRSNVGTWKKTLTKKAAAMVVFIGSVGSMPGNESSAASSTRPGAEWTRSGKVAISMCNVLGCRTDIGSSKSCTASCTTGKNSSHRCCFMTASRAMYANAVVVAVCMWSWLLAWSVSESTSNGITNLMRASSDAGVSKKDSWAMHPGSLKRSRQART
mmetsp:Transcript_68963/g.200073  ORF Transcript_68963/g.200073 Transcript_68963/m.200073 type:complete len:281 (+) Transcript_68963:2700-3542(+)